MKHRLSCLPAMTATSTKQWLPPHDPEPATEVMSGDLYLLTSTCKARAVRCPVHVQIYRSCFGHYAVLTASLRVPATFLNLRSCNSRLVLTNSDSSSSSSSSPSSDSRPRRFRVELGGGEGQVIYFEVSPRDSVSVEEWVSAFQGAGVPTPGNISPSLSPIIPRNPIMPTLQESIKEEEEEEEGEEEEVDGEPC